ncbi:MAG: glycosyl transferase group 1 [Acidimicrobiales bacterium]|nr:glycosyl transferase group 1 [Acidimicrobiales bacterium]
MLRVALDVTATITGSTGVARYARQLTAALGEQGVETVPYAIGRPQHPVPPGVRHVAIPLRVVQRMWTWTGRPRAETFTPGVDLVHALDLAPPPSRLPIVATVHDLTAVDHPELHPARRVAQQRAQLRALTRANVVISNSHATAASLVAHGIDGDRVVVTHFGRTPLPIYTGSPRGGNPYLLVVGEVTRRKGHDVLLRAFAAAALDGVDLVVAGPAGFDADFRDPLVASLGLAPRVSFLGYVDDAVLGELYAGALALCFPSRAEGFGLPILEALAAGLPVVASDLDAFHELAGDDALYVPPDDEEALARALRAVVEDDGLRARLSAAGPVRAAPFTWERTAVQTVDAYRMALS